MLWEAITRFLACCAKLSHTLRPESFCASKVFFRKFRMFVPQGYPPPPLMEIWYAKKISGIEQYFPSPLDCSLSLFFFVPQEKNMTIKLARLTTHPPHRALEGGQFRFSSNLKVSFFVHLWHISVIWGMSSHI